ncbi:flagellar biosynthesis protein FlgL [Qipengyuania sp.]|uniref:flagellin N-terminal helical domain-containing protein n=1 Tax=Qipengyuania sp. TaxID=2004515 RepID=UPI0035C79079
MTTVSTSAFYERSNLQLSSLRKQTEKLQTQIGTGQRLGTSADDPVAAARLRVLDRRGSLATVDKASADRAQGNLDLADKAIGEMAKLVIRAKELALQAASDTLGDAQRSSLGSELAALRENLLTLANGRDSNNNALFGGLTSGQAYQSTPPGATYLGTNVAPTTDLGAGQSVIEGVPGPDLFDFSHKGSPTNLFAVLGNLADALTAGGTGAGAAASDALGAFDTGLDKLTTTQTVVGTRLVWIDTVNDRRLDRSELEANEQSEIGGADLAASISKLQQTMTILEASQASFVKLANLSLFDLLR